MPLSKPFVVATEGPTVDGRNISRDWITQMAANYDTKVYTAVANLEHYLSALPDSPFSALGKVVSLSTQEAEILGEKKLQLLAVVDASDSLVAMQKAGKKLFCSMEVFSNFIGKGIAYLTGLAFTDTPASIGTETMRFSVAGAPGERFAFADAVAIEFEAAAKETGLGATLFAKISAILGKGEKKAEENFADQNKAITTLAETCRDVLNEFSGLKKENTQLTADLDALSKEFTAIKQQLETADASGAQRPAATGSDGKITTDC